MAATQLLPFYKHVKSGKVRNEYYLQAFDGERYIGSIKYRFHRERLELLDIRVTPEYRRRRIGSGLVWMLATKVRRQNQWLTYLGNCPGDFLYRCGFVHVASIDGYKLFRYEVNQ